MAEIFFNMHNRLKIKSGILIDVPRYFRMGNIEDLDLVVKIGEVGFKGIEAFAPLYTYLGHKTLVHKYNFVLPRELSLRNFEGKTDTVFTESYYRIVQNAKKLVEAAHFDVSDAYRLRSAENVVEEFEYITNNTPEVKEVGIEDDTLITSPECVHKICNEIEILKGSINGLQIY